MKYISLIATSFLLFLVSACGNDVSEKTGKSKEAIREELLKAVELQEAEMHKSPELNIAIAGVAIKAYYDFTTMFPDDSLSPDFIFKAAEIATATKQYPQALGYYQTIEEKYTSYKLYPESLFLQASLLDNFINDDLKAKVVYEKLIAKYPTSSYANDAKFAIANLGKTDEELHKEFMKKNGEK
jgi:outer membrane protein assembly factor BamD (BamD/ComL family)